MTFAHSSVQHFSTAIHAMFEPKNFERTLNAAAQKFNALLNFPVNQNGTLVAIPQTTPEHGTQYTEYTSVPLAHPMPPMPQNATEENPMLVAGDETTVLFLGTNTTAIEAQDTENFAGPIAFLLCVAISAFVIAPAIRFLAIRRQQRLNQNKELTEADNSILSAFDPTPEQSPHVDLAATARQQVLQDQQPDQQQQQQQQQTVVEITQQQQSPLPPTVPVTPASTPETLRSSPTVYY